MRVLLTGAYGLIGAACLTRLHAAGHDLVAAGRSIAVARRRFPYARWIEADFVRFTDPNAWVPLLAGIDAVVNCVGVLQDGSRDDVQRVQFAATVALFDACTRAGVKRVIHISAIGADAAGPSAFSRTKAAAEAHLATLALDWVILRPALVLAPAVYGGSAMLRGVAAFPGFVPLLGGAARLQVVGIDDVAETVARALVAGAPSRVAWDVAHPQVYTLAAIVAAIRGWLGVAPRRVVRLPDAAGRVIAPIADAIGWLGWRSPARTTSFAQLTAGVVGDPAGWMAATGIRPQSLDELLSAHPANVQDRWFARLYLIKPLALAGLAVAAMAAGAQEILSYWKMAASVVPQVWSEPFALYVLPGLVHGAITLAVGAGIVFRATARPALIALFVLNLLHAADHAMMAWHFKFMPFGAVSTDIPVLLATLFTLAILDAR